MTGTANHARMLGSDVTHYAHERIVVVAALAVSAIRAQHANVGAGHRCTHAIRLLNATEGLSGVDVVYQPIFAGELAAAAYARI